ncbi:hypothetical protein BU24DRAFT_421272 [Aaosphaeria arxii CBS 175.79]|uniref:Uncharacterized protein n=1 Tax=Aaosphaeria arxii CBS 175.79 TaxID=1450172 RepID=A0A6A5Y008_9PLEO|nr:uncharacterized protein BU24DRAFT_421272 [Aaosphaeria arxii CBS 175.79]KAF2018291.1 hypothetical protein BU24DRAFT_421272 [Aaosphaeria arxii CBS 175.79]
MLSIKIWRAFNGNFEWPHFQSVWDIGFGGTQPSGRQSLAAMIEAPAIVGYFNSGAFKRL